jgi:energy-coupling factor transport system ATP-binding protein
MNQASMAEEAALSIEHLSFKYSSRDGQALKDINLRVLPGQVMLLAGASGSGKTTLMRCINGLIPRTYHGFGKGEISVFGESVRKMSMANLSQVVGTLLQDPERQIVASYVLNEIAFGLENLGLPRAEIYSRIDETLSYLKISHLRDRETFHLSGGEKQKVALAAVLAMRPRILLLDEPLASLDPASAHEALQLFRQLADDGIAILLVEHRVEDVLAIHPEQVAYMEDGALVYVGDAAGLVRVVDYKRIKLPAPAVVERTRADLAAGAPQAPAIRPALPPHSDIPLIQFKDVHFRYRAEMPAVLRAIDFTVYPGDVIAILGHNGAGKTTLVKHALGLLKPTQGQVLLEGRDTRQTTVAQAAHTVGYVFQSPSQMLFAPTVEEELTFGPRNLDHAPEQIKKDVAWAIQTVNLASELKMPPLALSFGQQKRISIAAVLAMRSRILMMDEPTAGQDYWNYQAFMDSILQMPGFDAILFITHDLDLALIYANRILLVDQGQIMADGSPQQVLADEDLLRRSRILPTSLLRLNLEHLSRTGQFLRAESLAQYPG